MPKRTHPADVWTNDVIAHAVEWTAFMQAGRITRRFDNRAAAEAAALDLANQRDRPAIVYAIDAAGRSAFVGTFQPSRETIMSSEIRPMSSAEIAQLTALITGGGFKRANSKEAAAARFIKIATEAGIDDPETILTGHFALAEKVVRERLTAKLKAAIPTPAEAVARPLVSAIRHDAINRKLAEIDPEKAPNAATETTKIGKRAAAREAAQRGELPAAPDFTASTHKPHRAKLAKLVAMVEAGDIEGLRAFPINPISSSPKAMDKYRTLAVVALEAQRTA